MYVRTYVTCDFNHQQESTKSLLNHILIGCNIPFYFFYIKMQRIHQVKEILSRSQVAKFSSFVKGSKYNPTFKQYLKLSNGRVGSYFHDVPLDLDPQTATVNMITEIPRWSQAKFEINKEENWNPIMQDCSKTGTPRFVKNLFPFHGYIHNYGALPRTWEDPIHQYPGTSFKGDNDPLDCCEIGSQVIPMGSIRKVKLLGSLALIDDNELDWKIIVIDCQDPLALKVNNLDDVETYFPQLLHNTREWFRNYKIPDGKPANKFAFDEKYMGVEETLKVIKQCHESWKKLMEFGDINNNNLPNRISNFRNSVVSDNMICESELQSDSKIPESVSKWYYV